MDTDVAKNSSGRINEGAGERPGAQPGPPGASAPAPDFGNFIRSVFPEIRTAEDASLGSVAPLLRGEIPPIRRDYQAALDLLQRAAEAFPHLLRHCQALEAEMRHTRADALAEVEAAHGEVQQWQQIAMAMKMHIESSEHQIALLRQRLAAAEERLAAGSNVAKAAEQQASVAMTLSTLLHNKIMDSFGTGSPVHAVIEAAVADESLGDAKEWPGGESN